MSDTILMALFALSAILVIYHHIGYPLLLAWYAKNHPVNAPRHANRGFKAQKEDDQCASITILVPAYNEQAWIAEKIRNLACLDYPKHKYQVMILCDGCTDDTVHIAQQTVQEAICADTHFEIKNFATNRGKVAVLNEQIPLVTTQLTALSDVSAIISVDALILANTHFQNRQVGVVNGHYQLFGSQHQGENRYWQYQTKVKQQEVSLGSTLGAHGAFYLFRTSLFDSLDENTINDDFILPMRIVKKGYQAVYEPELVALELEPTDPDNDFKRRLRISAGNMQQVIQLADMLLPKYRGVAFAFLSGKGLRLATPYLLIVCFITALLLASYPLFSLALFVQCLLYTTAVLSYLFPILFRHKVCKVMLYVVMGHYANFVGGLRYLCGVGAKGWTGQNQ